jgi:hypothetical protein
MLAVKHSLHFSWLTFDILWLLSLSFLLPFSYPRLFSRPPALPLGWFDGWPRWQSRLQGVSVRQPKGIGHGHMTLRGREGELNDCVRTRPANEMSKYCLFKPF